VDLVKAGKNFTEALASVRGSLKALITEMDALKVEEAEVTFGLKAVGEAGRFAVGKVVGEMNYAVTLKWKKPAEKPKIKK
jgi:NTP-dependent ternary system trypsin peptidase co-occuring protein